MPEQNKDKKQKIPEVQVDYTLEEARGDPDITKMNNYDVSSVDEYFGWQPEFEEPKEIDSFFKDRELQYYEMDDAEIEDAAPDSIDEFFKNRQSKIEESTAINKKLKSSILNDLDFLKNMYETELSKFFNVLIERLEEGITADDTAFPDVMNLLLEDKCSKYILCGLEKKLR